MARSEKAKDGVEKEKADSPHRDTYDNVERHVVSENAFCRLVVFLTEFHRQISGRTYTYGSTECRCEVHERESDGKS